MRLKACYSSALMPTMPGNGLEPDACTQPRFGLTMVAFATRKDKLMAVWLIIAFAFCALIPGTWPGLILFGLVWIVMAKSRAGTL